MTHQRGEEQFLLLSNDRNGNFGSRMVDQDDNFEDTVNTKMFHLGFVRDNATSNKPASCFWRRRFILLCVLAAIVALGVFSFTRSYREGKRFQRGANKREFDYIVVGGGPAGIIAASELARKFPRLRVLLLESGTASQSAVLAALGRKDSERVSFDGPSIHLNRFDIPLMWSGVASSQERINTLNLRGISSNHHWPIEKTLLARGLGGCGLHNAMIYVRSLPSDFERWNSSLWSFEHILPHLKALERYDNKHGSSPDFWEGVHREEPFARWRGLNGTIITARAGISVDPLATLFLRSALSSGESLAAEGFNSPDPTDRLGVGYYEFNIRDGVRDSVANAYLGDPDRLPKNLVIETGVTVKKVVTRNTGHRPCAIGVETLEKEKSFWLSDMSSEVILAAGAIMTPQLLGNSGIGANGSVVDLPGVGQDLQDHPVVAVKYTLDQSFAENSSSIFTIGNELEDYLLAVAGLRGNASYENGAEQLYERLGTLGTAGFSAGAFLRSPVARTQSPDIQLTVFPRLVEPHVTGKLSRSQEAYMRSHVMLITVALIDADGRYRVVPSFTGQNKAPDQQSNGRTDSDSVIGVPGFSLPSIQLPAEKASYLSQRDVKALSWGVEQVRKFLRNDPMLAVVRDEILPGIGVSGPALENHVRKEATSNSHWVGSTRIGPKRDKLAVVDERLRVQGVDALRIVDSGVIPFAPNGNTHSTVCVVARRGTELIADDRK